MADFGMARKLYYESNYEKKGQVISTTFSSHVFFSKIKILMNYRR